MPSRAEKYSLLASSLPSFFSTDPNFVRINNLQEGKKNAEHR